MGRNGLTCLVETLVTIVIVLSISKGGLRGSAFQLLKLVRTEPSSLSRSYGTVVGDFSTIIETRRLSARRVDYQSRRCFCSARLDIVRRILSSRYSRLR